nr:hypothetical protein [Halanaeroarchaeum sp. HSR-CO]
MSETIEVLEVTEKVTADTIGEVNHLEERTLQEHGRTERLLRESSNEFETSVFDD